MSTASFQDPPTMAAARQRIHELARELPSQYDNAPRFFDDETQARQIDGDLIMASRPQARQDQLDVPYNALPSLEVARPFDEYEEQFAERDPETQLRGARYSDEHRRPSEPPPAKIKTKGYGAPSEDSGPRQRPRKNATPVPQYDAVAYEANYPGIRRQEESFADRHESFDSRRPEHESYRSSARREERSSYSPPPPPPARNDAGLDAIPQAPAVPREMQVPAGFVMGVQPIRTPGSVAAAMPAYADAQAPEAFPAPYPQTPSRTPMMGVPYGQPVPPVQSTAPRGVNASAQYMAIHAGTSGQFAPPVGHQLQMTDLEEARQGSKVGRFAWFVFGAAFGIFFAFCATGFVPRLGKKEEIAFPPPAQLPAQEQAPVAVAPPQPVPVQVPVQPVVAVTQLPMAVPQPEPQPIVQQPVFAAAPPAFAPAPAPQPIVQQPVVAPQPVVAAPAPAPQPVVAQPAPAPQPVVAAPAPQPQYAAAPAPAPRGQRGAAIARRNAPPPSSAPRALPNSGSVDSDDAPSAPASRVSASKESKGGADVGGISDLLSAGLAP